MLYSVKVITDCQDYKSFKRNNLEFQKAYDLFTDICKKTIEKIVAYSGERNYSLSDTNYSIYLEKEESTQMNLFQ